MSGAILQPRQGTPVAPRTLARFARDCGGTLHGADAPLGEVLIDSRRIARGDLFCALPGTRVDGHEYLAAAAAAGAAGALVARPVDAPLSQVVVADVAAAMAAAQPGDVVLVAGKGHEDYQLVGAEKRAFSDLAQVRAALGERSAA